MAKNSIGHFLDSEMRNRFVVLGIKPIRGAHTAEKFAEICSPPVLDEKIRALSVSFKLRDF